MWTKSASDEVHLCSFQKNGYASGHVLRCGLCLPNLLRQQTSHIQQASPTSGVLNSFVLPIHKWVPLLLFSEVKPQGEILMRLTGSKLLIHFTFFYSASLQMDVRLNRILLVVKRLLPVPDGGYPCGTVCCCNPFHATEAHRRCGSTYSPQQSLPVFPSVDYPFGSCNRCTLPGNLRCCGSAAGLPETVVCAVSFARAC